MYEVPVAQACHNDGYNQQNCLHAGCVLDAVHAVLHQSAQGGSVLIISSAVWAVH
jgi:hypothetical protein